MTHTAQPISPFVLDETSQATDQQLVADVLTGNQSALETLVSRHQPWIYNLAFRMVMVREDAEDVTQEVLVKVITKLGSYDPAKSAFRTWLYRIVANHVINMKTRGYEAAVTDLESYYSFVTQVPDQDPDASPDVTAWLRDLIQRRSFKETWHLDETREVTA